MRTCDAQRLIFGSLGLIVVLFGGSLVWLQAALMPEVQAPVAVGGGGLNSEPVEINFAEKNFWAEAGTKEVTLDVEHYELSGTFQIFSQDESEVDEVQTVALIDDLRINKQIMVNEKDELGEFVVEKIELDRVTLTKDGRQFVLVLSGYVAPRVREVVKKEEAPPKIVRMEDMPALETTPFGKRVSDNQWVIDREAVMAYAEGIMGSPIRATQLYLSFSQVKKQEGDVAGFAIDMKGEQEFFQSMGLNDGDIIRRANSMKMENQGRAEYLVREFMKSNMSAVVLDVENNGVVRKQIFIVR